MEPAEENSKPARLVEPEEDLDAAVKAAEKLAPVHNNDAEFDGHISELGLNGVLIRFDNELELWNLKKRVRLLHPVHVRLTLKE